MLLKMRFGAHIRLLKCDRKEKKIERRRKEEREGVKEGKREEREGRKEGKEKGQREAKN